MQDITYRTDSFIKDLSDHPDRHVHLIMIATKPDIIKQVPLYLELKKRGKLVVLGHTGQHYDENLSGGMLKEFGVEPDFNLNVRGVLYEVVSQIIGRLGHVIGEMKEIGKTVIPYIHGDTTTCMAAGNAGFAHGFASVHVEAALRTLTPLYAASDQWISGAVKNYLDFHEWRNWLMKPEHWGRGSQEPYPEQFNTRSAEAGTGIHLAATELNQGFLIAEGYPEDRIFVVGNSVADATMQAMENAKNSTIFEQYPMLADGDFVRFCIHRRENCISEKRFMAIFNAMKILIEKGTKVLLISLHQTEKAFERFGLKEEIDRLNQEYETFLYSPVWPQYTDVIAAMSKAAVCATDSGSMQEEMNIMGIPCVTLRFGSDRSESIIAGANVLAPPVDAEFIVKIIEGAWNFESMKQIPNLYGENVSAKCIDKVFEVIETRGEEVFRDERARLGF